MISLLIKLLVLSYATDLRPLASFKLKFDSLIKTSSYTSTNDQVYQENAFSFQDKEGNILKILIQETKGKKDSEVKKEISKMILHFRENYLPSAAPYTGMITQKLECKNKFNLAPKLNEDEKSISAVFNVLTGKDYKFNDCDSEGPSIKAQYQIIYCKKSMDLFQLKFFSPMVSLTKGMAQCE